MEKTVIIADDDEDLLQMLVFAFESEGFVVHGFSKGQEALEYISDEAHLKNISLIILDRLFPDMDGMDILHRVSEKGGGKIPVMILSVLSSEMDVLAGLRKGAIEYVTKPFSLPILLEKAYALMEKRG